MRLLFSAVLSFLMPGLGQYYNGQLIKGTIFYLLYIILFFVLYFLNLFQTFNGLIVIVIIAISLYLYIIVDAIYFSNKKKKENAFQKKWPLFIILIIFHFLISSQYKEYVNSHFITAHKVKTNSMEPTLKVGDYFITDYNYYKSNPVKPNDVLILQFPKDPNKKFVERCIAISGQKIEIKDKIVYIDGNLFTGFQLNQLEGEVDSSSLDTGDKYGPVTVPVDHCFVLGDNRDNSYDSRYWGFLPVENVISKPLYIYWSKDYSRIGKVIN